jgi:hypothetical protein
MMDEMKVTFHRKKRTVSVEFDQLQYSAHVVMTATTLLNMSGQFLPEDHKLHRSGSTFSDTMKVLELDCYKGLTHVYDQEQATYALAFLADEVYIAVQAVCEGELPTDTFADWQVRVIVDALATWQQCKKTQCVRLEQKHGKGYGADTDFYKQDWSDLNAEFLKVWRKH